MYIVKKINRGHVNSRYMKCWDLFTAQCPRPTPEPWEKEKKTLFLEEGDEEAAKNPVITQVPMIKMYPDLYIRA